MEQNKEHTPTIEEVLEKHMEDRPSKIIEESYLESVYDAMKEWASIETEQLRQQLKEQENDFMDTERESNIAFAKLVEENKTLIERIKELEKIINQKPKP